MIRGAVAPGSGSLLAAKLSKHLETNVKLLVEACAVEGIAKALFGEVWEEGGWDT